MQEINHPNDLEDFKRNYESISGLSIPDDYLRKSKVYISIVR